MILNKILFYNKENMKKILTILIIISGILNVSAYSQEEKLAADFLSYKDIINSHDNPKNYELDKEITRREMAKVTLKLSWKEIYNKCENLFTDLKKWDWWCKYAENWVAYWFFTLNKKFNPEKNISKIESLKMIMKAKGIKKEEAKDWREWYVNSALKYWLIKEKFSDYDTKVKRWWIFVLWQNAIEFSWDDEDTKIIEKLLNL